MITEVRTEAHRSGFELSHRFGFENAIEAGMALATVVLSQDLITHEEIASLAPLREEDMSDATMEDVYPAAALEGLKSALQQRTLSAFKSMLESDDSYFLSEEYSHLFNQLAFRAMNHRSLMSVAFDEPLQIGDYSSAHYIYGQLESSKNRAERATIATHWAHQDAIKVGKQTKAVVDEGVIGVTVARVGEELITTARASSTRFKEFPNRKIVPRAVMRTYDRYPPRGAQMAPVDRRPLRHRVLQPLYL